MSENMSGNVTTLVRTIDEQLGTGLAPPYSASTVLPTSQLSTAASQFNDSNKMLSLNGSLMSRGTEHTSAIDLTISIVIYFLGICAIVLNIGFLFAMFRTKSCANTAGKEGASAYQCFVKGLSFADILATISFLIAMKADSPMSAIAPGAQSFFVRSGLPYIIRGVPWLFFTAYFLMLTCLSVNQYVAVCRPLKYDVIAQPRLVTSCIVVVCVISSCQVLVPFIVSLALNALDDAAHAHRKLRQISKIEMEVWMCVFILSTVVNIALNLLMYVKLRELKWKRRQSARRTHETLNIRIMHEAFVTICLLLLITILLRLPLPITSIVSIEMEYARINWSIFTVVNHVVILLLFTNFFADPIIYISRMREARAFIQTMTSTCVSGCSRDGTGCRNAHAVEMNLMPGEQLPPSETNGNAVKNSTSVKKALLEQCLLDSKETTCMTDY